MACRLLPCRPRDDLAGDCVAAGRAGQLAAARPHGAASGADVSSAPAAAAGGAGCAVAARTAAQLDARWIRPALHLARASRRRALSYASGHGLDRDERCISWLACSCGLRACLALACVA